MERERQRAGEKTAGNLKADKGREMAESKTVGNTAGRGLAARRAKEQGQESGGEAGRVHLRAEDRRKG